MQKIKDLKTVDYIENGVITKAKILSIPDRYSSLISPPKIDIVIPERVVKEIEEDAKRRMGIIAESVELKGNDNRRYRVLYGGGEVQAENIW